MKTIIFFLVIILLVACQQTPQKNEIQTAERLSFQEVKTLPEKAEQTQPEVNATQHKAAQQEQTKDDIIKDDYQKAMEKMNDTFQTTSEVDLEPNPKAEEQALIYLDDSDSLRQLEFGYLQNGWVFDIKSQNFMDEELFKDPLLKAIFQDVDAIVRQINKMEPHSQRVFATGLLIIVGILRSNISEQEKQKQAFAAVSGILDLVKMVGEKIPHVYDVMPTSGKPEGELDLLQVQRALELIVCNELSPISVRMVGD